MALVDPRVYPLAALDISFFGRESLSFGFQAQEDGLREAVSKVKGHVLRHVRAFEVRQIAATVPPGSAILLNGVVYTANREIGVPGILQRSQPSERL